MSFICKRRTKCVVWIYLANPFDLSSISVSTAEGKSLSPITAAKAKNSLHSKKRASYFMDCLTFKLFYCAICFLS